MRQAFVALTCLPLIACASQAELQRPPSWWIADHVETANRLAPRLPELNHELRRHELVLKPYEGNPCPDDRHEQERLYHLLDQYDQCLEEMADVYAGLARAYRCLLSGNGAAGDGGDPARQDVVHIPPCHCAGQDAHVYGMLFELYFHKAEDARTRRATVRAWLDDVRGDRTK